MDDMPLDLLDANVLVDDLLAIVDRCRYSRIRACIGN